MIWLILAEFLKIYQEEPLLVLKEPYKGRDLVFYRPIKNGKLDKVDFKNLYKSWLKYQRVIYCILNIKITMERFPTAILNT